MPRALPILHGGVNGDRPGPAHLEVQLEQDRDKAVWPLVALTVTVDQAAHTVWMSLPEVRALGQGLGGLLDDIDT